jgi:DNA-binding LytR/AlgR family response regulator
LNKIRIAICDDEISQIKYLTNFVNRWAQKTKNPVEIRGFPSAEAFLFAMETFDVLLLDIQMGGQNGMELAKKLRAQGERAAIIFITGYADFVYEGYSVDALHYLMKPVDENKLYETLNKAINVFNKPTAYLMFESENGPVRLAVSDLLYAESFGHKMELNTLTKKYITRMRIHEFQAYENLYRCHRSYVINLLHVRRVARTEAALDNGASVPVSRRLYDGLNRAFVDLYKKDLLS